MKILIGIGAAVVFGAAWYMYRKKLAHADPAYEAPMTSIPPGATLAPVVNQVEGELTFMPPAPPSASSPVWTVQTPVKTAVESLNVETSVPGPVAPGGISYIPPTPTKKLPPVAIPATTPSGSGIIYIDPGELAIQQAGGKVTRSTAYFVPSGK